MGNKGRDEFPARVINALAKRVAYRCSNPDCRVPTIAASKEEEAKFNTIGKAAHICAAAAGGPRYDETMSSDERKSINNGLWLCSICADKIDRDTFLHSKNLLLDWRKLAENTSIMESGKQLPSDKDAIHLLTQALLGDQPKVRIFNAITNVHQASVNALEALDSRFFVKSSYYDAQEKIELFAKQSIQFRLKVAPDLATEFDSKHLKLIEDGEVMQIHYSSGQIQVEGSPLLTEIFKDAGHIELNPPSILGVLRLNFIDNKTKIVESFNDTPGVFRYGRKKLTFEGQACGGIVLLKVVLNWQTSTATFSANFDFGSWVGKDLRLLTYLDKVVMFSEAFSLKKSVQLSLEADGLEVSKGEGILSTGELKYE
jgi:hypothetical protein